MSSVQTRIGENVPKKNKARTGCTKENKDASLCTKETKNRGHGTRNAKILVQGGSRKHPKLSWFFDAPNIKILEAIKNGHIQEEIINLSQLSKNATIHRLKKMQAEKLIERNMVQDEIDINKTHILYSCTKTCTKLLIGDDEQIQHQDFRSHEQKYKFELYQDEETKKRIKSIPCVNLRPLKNNDFKDFYRDNSTIRLTSKHICVFVTTRLEAGNIDDLNIKYIELAKTEARKFAEEYNLKYNPVPTLYQPSTFDCITAEPLAKVMRDRGNFNINTTGIKARIDPSDKGIESNEENAREIEYRLFKSPVEMMNIRSDIANLRSDFQTEMAGLRSDVIVVKQQVEDLTKDQQIKSLQEENIKLRQQLTLKPAGKYEHDISYG